MSGWQKINLQFAIGVCICQTLLGHCPSVLWRSLVYATHLKITHPQMKSAGARSSNELQWLDLKRGRWDSSPSNGCQGDIPCKYCEVSFCPGISLCMHPANERRHYIVIVMSSSHWLGTYIKWSLFVLSRILRLSYLHNGISYSD